MDVRNLQLNCFLSTNPFDIYPAAQVFFLARYLATGGTDVNVEGFQVVVGELVQVTDDANRVHLNELLVVEVLDISDNTNVAALTKCYFWSPTKHCILAPRRLLWFPSVFLAIK